jgi:cobalt-zinc-cadmium efflux system membrane fusion protein
VSVKAYLGDKVTRGEVLAELDSIELGQAKSEYLKARADLEVARANFSREERLYNRQITSEKEYLDAKGEFLRAEAALNTSRETLRLLGLSDADVKSISWSERKSPPSMFPLKAPFDGIIIEQHTVLGELVTSQDNAYTITDLTHLWIQLDVYEKDLRHVGKGKPVDIMVDAYPDEKFTGEVTYISDVLDETTRTARARVEIENPDGRLKPGMFASALITIPGEGGDALTVPSSAIQQVRGKPTVFVREGEGIFEAKEITTGRESGDLVEVTDGISPGDEVVTEGGFYLKSLLLKDEMGEGHAH